MDMPPTYVIAANNKILRFSPFFLLLANILQEKVANAFFKLSVGQKL